MSGYLELVGVVGAGDLKRVKQCLKNGSSADERLNDECVLNTAAYHGYKEIVRVLLNHDANVEVKNRHSTTPLITAAWKGHREVVEMLLDKEANINARDCNGYNALMKALDENHEEIAELLLDRGANVGLQNMHGWNSLMMAVIWVRNPQRIVQTILTHPKVKVDINARDNKGKTVLMMAANRGFTGIVNMLLIRGADRDLKNEEGKTALNIAKEKNKRGVVRLLEACEGIVDTEMKFSNYSLNAIFRREAKNYLSQLRQRARTTLKPIIDQAVKDGKNDKEALAEAQPSFPVLLRQMRKADRPAREQAMRDMDTEIRNFRH